MTGETDGLHASGSTEKRHMTRSASMGGKEGLVDYADSKGQDGEEGDEYEEEGDEYEEEGSEEEGDEYMDED
jgi:hypothetical protein